MRQVGQLAVKRSHERVAACLIVAVGIAFPIALANSEAFREQILQLVLSINPETGMAHVGMEPAKEEQTANVPRMDVPDVRVEFMPSYEPTGPFGAKSIGEIVINTPAPAIAHAIYRATGVWHRELPILPEHVLLAKPEAD